MKRTILILGLVILCCGLLVAGNDQDMEKQKAEIQEVIEKAYVEGIHINRDSEAIRSGFHPEFNMLVLREDKITKVPIKNWIARIEESKKRHPEPSAVKTTHKFSLVDITGNAAVAKIEIFKDSKQVFTDYMSLYKFDDGWKIVNKIFHHHK